MNPGFLYAALAFTSWGLFPLYFRQVASVQPLEVVLHRSAWSLAFLLIVLAVLRRWAWLPEVLSQPRRLLTFGASALLLSGNWFIYVLAVQHGHVVEASLGYFINPLVNVLLGVLVLGERLRRVQWVSVALAAVGVAWLTVLTGHLPGFALALAISFALYGLMRKTASLGPLEGLALENLLLAPVIVPLLVWFTVRGDGALSRGDLALDAWLLLAGPLTAVPLLWFAAGARRLSLASLGLIQYLSPTLQLVVAVWALGEPFDRDRLIGFAFIWAALALYSAESSGLLRRLTPSSTAPHPGKLP